MLVIPTSHLSCKGMMLYTSQCVATPSTAIGTCHWTDGFCLPHRLFPTKLLQASSCCRTGSSSPLGICLKGTAPLSAGSLQLSQIAGPVSKDVGLFTTEFCCQGYICDWCCGRDWLRPCGNRCAPLFVLMKGIEISSGVNLGASAIYA